MFLELIVRGIAIGLIYALMGVGLVLLNGVMRIINFAHGEFYMIGGYAAYYLMTLLDLPFYLAIPGAMGITFWVGVIIERLLLSPIHQKQMEKPMDYALIITFGLVIFFRKVAALIFGPFYRKPPDYIQIDLSIAGIHLGGDMTLTLIASASLVIGLSYFIRKTWRGRSWRAITQSQRGAKIMGVDIARESWIAFGTACALAAAAGALVAPLFLISPSAGGPPLLKSYEVLAIGGLGSIGGSLIAGILLGISETLGSVYISSAYKDAIGFVFMALFLIFWPGGLFGQKQ
jgi:branched-chain amino acid transport system permease protein